MPDPPSVDQFIVPITAFRRVVAAEIDVPAIDGDDGPAPMLDADDKRWPCVVAAYEFSESWERLGVGRADLFG